MSEHTDESTDLCDFEPPSNSDGTPTEFPAGWRTEPVRTLARVVREELARDVRVGTARMAALEEAGCDNPVVLNHCRLCPDHTPDCWVIGLALPDTLRDEPPAAPSPLRRAADRTAVWIVRGQLLMVAVGLGTLLIFGLLWLVSLVFFGR